MFRLILLTIVGLFAVLAFYGTPEMAGGSTVAEDVDVRAVAPAIPVAQTVAAAPAGIPADVLIRAAMAGPAPQEAMVGPRLRVSPELAGRDSAAAPTDVPIDGALLYATGDQVNLRDVPAVDGRVVVALTRGDPVRAVAPAVGPWVEVEVGTAGRASQRGFVSARYLSPNRPG